MPPVDVIAGLVGIFFFGLCLGAAIFLPYAHKQSNLPLEKLSNDIIWRYTPDWILYLLGCIVFIVIGFVLVSGYLVYQ